MKKPASAGAHGLSGNVSLVADTSGYAATPSVLQAHTVIRRHRVSPALAATIAALAFGVAEDWRVRA